MPPQRALLLEHLALVDLGAIRRLGGRKLRERLLDRRRRLVDLSGRGFHLRPEFPERVRERPRRVCQRENAFHDLLFDAFRVGKVLGLEQCPVGHIQIGHLIG